MCCRRHLPRRRVRTVITAAEATVVVVVVVVDMARVGGVWVVGVVVKAAAVVVVVVVDMARVGGVWVEGVWAVEVVVTWAARPVSLRRHRPRHQLRLRRCLHHRRPLSLLSCHRRQCLPRRLRRLLSPF